MTPRPATVKVVDLPITTGYTCVECRTARAVVFNSDGRYRCRPCQRAWADFARRLRRSADDIIGARERRRFR